MKYHFVLDLSKLSEISNIYLRVGGPQIQYIWNFTDTFVFLVTSTFDANNNEPFLQTHTQEGASYNKI